MNDPITAAHQICKTFSKNYGVDCKDKTVDSCYRNIAKQVHPDKHPKDKDRFTRIFQDLGNTYEGCKDVYQNTSCNSVPEPELRPSSNPTVVRHHISPKNKTLTEKRGKRRQVKFQKVHRSKILKRGSLPI